MAILDGILAGRASEPMVLHIIGVLDDYMHAFPLLAFVRGEAFTPEHWFVQKSFFKKNQFLTF